MIPSVQNESSDSRARDHLANERTYLAWVRTGANVMILGLALAKLVGGGGFALAAGALLVAVGALGLGVGTMRYRRVNTEIEQGVFLTGSRGRAPTVATAVLVIAVVAAFLLLLAGGSIK